MNKLTSEQTKDLTDLMAIAEQIKEHQAVISDYQNQIARLETEEHTLKTRLYTFVNSFPCNEAFVAWKTDELVHLKCLYDKLYVYHRSMFVKTS